MINTPRFLALPITLKDINLCTCTFHHDHVPAKNTQNVIKYPNKHPFNGNSNNSWLLNASFATFRQQYLSD